jgi:endonuclease/exonuclease/phosphatase family metal-dependent hydrolase
VPRKVLLGVVVTVALLVGLLSARAVGAIGGDEQPTAAPAESSSPSSTSDDASDPDQTAEDADDPGDEAGTGQDAAEKPEPGTKRSGKRQDELPRPRADRRSQRTDESQKDLASAVEDLLEEPDVRPTAFRVASFNVLGHSHTTTGGNKPGYAAGPARMRMAVQILRSYGADLIGFQEFEPVQNASFMRLTAGRYGTYPGMKLGAPGVRRTIAWRSDTWKLVQADTVPVPYFRGNRVPMPYVLLEHKKTGQRVWAMNVHNPTSNPKRGNNARWRAVSKQIQTNLVNRLHSQTEYPVILMGDFNERAEAFCAVTSRAPMRASNGGSSEGRCRPPGDLGIDWIFGTTDLEFTSHVRTRAGLVARASDHPIVVADALVTPGE